jgi:hypothetical protein
MAVDLVSKPNLHLLSYALTSELTFQSYSVDSQMIIIGVCVCVCVYVRVGECLFVYVIVCAGRYPLAVLVNY